MVSIVVSERNVGFYSSLLGIIYTAFINIKDEKIPHIIWKNPKYMAHENDNVFNYFFDQAAVDENDNNHIIKENGIRPSVILSLAKKSNRTFRQQMNHMFLTICKLKPDLQQKINKIAEELQLNGKKGIHIRRTDRFVGGKGLVYAGPSNELILSHLKNEKENNFYIATDCKDTYQLIESNFDCVSFASIRSSKTQGIHFSNSIQSSNKDIAEECFIEGMLLSKCSFLYRMTSNFTIFSLIVNPDIEFEDLALTYKKNIIEQFNLETLFIEDFLSI